MSNLRTNGRVFGIKDRKKGQNGEAIFFILNNRLFVGKRW